MRADRAEFRAREAREAAGVAPLPDVPITRIGSWHVVGTGYATDSEHIWAESIRAQRRHDSIRRPKNAQDPDDDHRAAW